MPAPVTVETHQHRWRPTTSADRRVRSADGWDLPVLRPRDGGPAERLADSFGGLHPVAGFVVAMLLGFATIAALSIGLGFLVTHVLEHVWGIGAADERVDVWLAAHRTSSRTDASLVGSTVAGGLVLPVLVGAIALVCAALRKWRLAAFVVFALAVESADLPRDHAPRPLASAARGSPRAPAGQRQLPVRSHGGVDRGLRRTRSAAHVAIHERPLPRARLDDRAAIVVFVAGVAHVSRHAPSA